MAAVVRYLNAAEAARTLGISAKALRIYERHGLLSPQRTAVGWRVYGPDEMARASEIVALRKLGLGLAQIAAAMTGLEPALTTHQAALEVQAQSIAKTLNDVRALRTQLASDAMPRSADMVLLPSPASPASEPAIAFDLPWPWGGERFEIAKIRPITYIVGPLGSGKTRLAKAIVAAVPGALFLGLDRLDADTSPRPRQPDSDRDRSRDIERALCKLVEQGATQSVAIVHLMTALELRDVPALVIDMIEQGLDEASQRTVAAYLRERPAHAPPLFIMTRSSAILDLTRMRPDEAVIFCPANHSPPLHVAPHPGAPGQEAVASCLGSPDVRARTAGMIAWLPGAA